MARPRKTIDRKQVEQLAAIDCSFDEIAAVVGCERTTLHRRFATVIEKARAKGRMSLKRTQFSAAVGSPAEYDLEGRLIRAERPPNPTMLIWLGKIRLGQKDTNALELTGAHGGPIQTQELPIDVLRAKLAARLDGVGHRLMQTGVPVTGSTGSTGSNGNGNGSNGNGSGNT